MKLKLILYYLFNTVRLIELIYMKLLIFTCAIGPVFIFGYLLGVNEVSGFIFAWVSFLIIIFGDYFDVETHHGKQRLDKIYKWLGYGKRKVRKTNIT